MLTPPETFPQLRSAQWLLPACLVLGGFLWVAGAGGTLSGVIQVAAPVAVLGWLLSQWLIWLSVFGVHATLLAWLVMVLALTLPFSVGLMPHLLPSGHGWVMVLAALLHLGVMGVTAFRQWQAWRLACAQGAQVLEAPLCHIQLTTYRIEPARPTAQPVKGGGKQTGLWVGAASVLAYPLISHWLGNGGILAIGACLGHGVALWLHMVVGARWLAMSCLLLGLERQTGRRFVSSQLEWLESQRQAHGWGRLLRRMWPCRELHRP